MWRSLMILCAAFLLGGCGSSDSDPVVQNVKISSCGGFNDGGLVENRTTTIDKRGEAVSETIAETSCELSMSWFGNEKENLFQFRLENLLSNCSGERSIDVVETGENSYTITLTDGPGEDGRAKCGTCNYDYQGEIATAGALQLKVYYDITDSGEEAELIWSGEIDTAEISGTFPIKSQDASLCQ